MTAKKIKPRKLNQGGASFTEDPAPTWKKPPSLMELEDDAIKAAMELDAVVSASSTNDYARDRLVRIYPFILAAVADPEGFAGRTSEKVKAGVAHAPYLVAVKHVSAAAIKANRDKQVASGHPLASKAVGGIRNSINRYARVLRYAAEAEVPADGLAAFLAEKGGVVTVEALDKAKNSKADQEISRPTKGKLSRLGSNDTGEQKDEQIAKRGPAILSLSMAELDLFRWLVNKVPANDRVAALKAKIGEQVAPAPAGLAAQVPDAPPAGQTFRVRLNGMVMDVISVERSFLYGWRLSFSDAQEFVVSPDQSVRDLGLNMLRDFGANVVNITNDEEGQGVQVGWDATLLVGEGMEVAA